MPVSAQFNMQKLKLVDNETRYLISGYFREIEDLLTLTIPELISVICTFYFYLFESFKQENSGPDVVIHGNYAEYEQGAFNTVYGNLIIDGNLFPNAVYQWTIAPIQNNDEYLNILIGITSNFNGKADTPYKVSEQYESYGIDEGGWIWRGNEWFDGENEAHEFDSGDIIRIQVNVSKGIIEFYKNDSKVVEMEIDNIYNSKFKLAISVSDCAVKLLDFKLNLS